MRDVKSGFIRDFIKSVYAVTRVGFAEPLEVGLDRILDSRGRVDIPAPVSPLANFIAAENLLLRKQLALYVSDKRNFGFTLAPTLPIF
jgi:hypothetical protein